MLIVTTGRRPTREMPAIQTIVTITPAELERIVERACARAVDQAFVRQAGASGAEWGIADVAASLGVSARTVLRMEQRGELPRRAGRKWRKADVLRWRQERAIQPVGPE